MDRSGEIEGAWVHRRVAQDHERCTCGRFCDRAPVPARSPKPIALADADQGSSRYSPASSSPLLPPREEATFDDADAAGLFPGCAPGKLSPGTPTGENSNGTSGEDHSDIHTFVDRAV